MSSPVPVSAPPPKKEEPEKELITPAVYGIMAVVFLAVLTLFVLFSTGSFIAVLVLWLLIGLILVVLSYYGFLDLEAIVDALFPSEKPKEEPPAPGNPLLGFPTVGSEVFHISDNQFTYDEAPAVCAAYGASLATLEQIYEAYNAGAEWCGYGWTAGGMALYPTQKGTWNELQREIDPAKRTACGRPGVNGGYFNPSIKFGVNCFGFKPKGDFKPPAPVPGTDQEKFRKTVNKFKEMLKTMNLAPFSRAEWSNYDDTYGAQFQQQLGKLTEGFAEYADPIVETVDPKGTSYTAAPYGLRGDKGDKGDKGDQGPAGPIGSQGPKGDKGDKGDKGEKGDQGPQGLQGLIGSVGPRGLTGSAGPAGPIGPKGDTGAVGPAGPSGGPRGPAGERGLTGPAGPIGPAGPAGPVGEPSSRDAIDDTRAVNTTPPQYWTRGRGVYSEFKSGAAINAPQSGTGFLETIVPWNDSTGGPIVQTFRSGGNMWERQSTGATTTATWGSWVKRF